MKSLTIAVLFLATTAAIAQPAPEKLKSGPSAPSGGQSGAAPPPGGATIVPDVRRNITKDIPMGGGKMKVDGPPPVGSANGKSAK